MTLAFLALLGAPYIYDISSLRVKFRVRHMFYWQTALLYLSDSHTHIVYASLVLRL